MGEHHPDFRDHLLQAALLRQLIATNTRSRPLAVGLEAVQVRFQPALDAYLARRISEEELFVATDWAKRWYWSFEAYAPIFRLCRDSGVDLVALDVDSEDKAEVELGGLSALQRGSHNRLRDYIPDYDGYERFRRTSAFKSYVSHTLQPPYALMSKAKQKMTMSTDAARDMPLEYFLDRQFLRDEAMAARAADWLQRNPKGRLLGLVGLNHVKFSCGAPARLARMLGPNGPNDVATILLNPTPATTFVDGPRGLRACDVRARVANEACVRNDIEVQNYVLQLPYDDGRDREAGGEDAAAAAQGQAEARADAAAVMQQQARRGSSVLKLADYMIFSPSSERRG